MLANIDKVGVQFRKTKTGRWAAFGDVSAPEPKRIKKSKKSTAKPCITDAVTTQRRSR